MDDLKLTADGDLDCSSLGLQLVTGPDRVAQQVTMRMRTFLGEWEFDLDAGVPWYQKIIGIKGVNLNEVDSVIRSQILSVKDVLSILSFSMDFDSTTRTLEINTKINTTFGVVVVEGSFP